MAQGNQSILVGKLKVTATLRVETGMHIGASSDFAPIGAVDKQFIRDPLTKQPIIPGSSLKGKIRTLLARSCSTQDYVLNDIDKDSPQIRRLFGSAAQGSGGGQAARLQFSDIRMTPESLAQFGSMELDTYIGEIKFENSINRATAVANPRQIERLPAGSSGSSAWARSLRIHPHIQHRASGGTHGGYADPRQGAPPPPDGLPRRARIARVRQSIAKSVRRRALRTRR